MAKQVKPRSVKSTPTLAIDRPIDDENIWFVRIESRRFTNNMPYRKSSLEDAFRQSGESWTVSVLGYWKDGDAKRWIESRTKEDILKQE